MAKSDPNRPGRVRAFKPKVSTGCRTCKVRRIKCDEAKPICKKCSSTGRKCDGYFYSSILPANSYQHNRPLIFDKQEIVKATPSIDTFPSLTILKSSLEQRSFSFFQQNTVPQLSSIFGSPSWKQLNRLLLQAAHHEPAVRHAAVALGALHEHFETRSRLLPRSEDKSLSTDFAVQQYVKALGCLVNPTTGQKPAADVALITCILFVCFENLRGEYSMALSHINGGVKIIEEIAEIPDTPISPGSPEFLSLSPTPSSSSSGSSLSVSPIPYVPLSTLSLVFIEFDVQASGLVNNRKRFLSARKFDMPSSGYGPDIPTVFSSADEACLALDHIRTEGVRMVDTVLRKQTPPDPQELRATLDLILNTSSTRMKQWSQALDEFVSKNPNIKNERSILMLKMHHTFMKVNTAVGRIGLVTDECVFDTFLPDFREMISLCTQIITTESKLDRPRPMFCLDTGIIIALFGVATKCRDGPTRWKAIDLLMSSDRQEGILNSILTAGVARRAIEIEETGLSQPVLMEDLPGERRLAGVEVKFEEIEKGATVKFLRKPPFLGPPGPGDVIEEFFEW
ncbi:hypothetical protein VTL71DRAFT_11364 [Oculimacula yallundae]|uniref:Zn(2)-C6 fungal-type domain-containing protein n=1 Tax=Oculimacula yallundae TaxID=86028 RepID=A0ABR4CRK5_9HELO